MNTYWKKWFGWSWSRHNMWNTCPRSYYYSYIGKWEPGIDGQRCKMLSKLISLPMAVGKFIHDAIKTVSKKLKKITSCGYKLINYFALPEDAWWTEYYKPLEVRIKELYMKYKNDSEALRILKKYQNEIDMVKRNPKEHSSAFFILRKKS